MDALEDTQMPPDDANYQTFELVLKGMHTAGKAAAAFYEVIQTTTAKKNQAETAPTVDMSKNAETTPEVGQPLPARDSAQGSPPRDSSKHTGPDGGAPGKQKTWREPRKSLCSLLGASSSKKVVNLVSKDEEGTRVEGCSIEAPYWTKWNPILKLVTNHRGRLNILFTGRGHRGKSTMIRIIKEEIKRQYQKCQVYYAQEAATRVTAAKDYTQVTMVAKNWERSIGKPDPGLTV